MKAMSVEEFKVDSLHVKFKSNQIQMTDYVDPLPVSVGMDDPEHNQHPEVQ
jgi:hypothetical protein